MDAVDETWTVQFKAFLEDLPVDTANVRKACAFLPKALRGEHSPGSDHNRPHSPKALTSNDFEANFQEWLDDDESTKWVMSDSAATAVAGKPAEAEDDGFGYDHR